jgi:hypothetical protein
MLYARSLILSSCVMALFSSCTSLWAAEGGKRKDAPPVRWLRDYGDALTAAKQQNQMLLIYFYDSSSGSQCQRFQKQTLDAPQVRAKLRDYVCVRLPMTTKITVQGKQVVLLEHAAFGEMLGRPGIAIVDYRSHGALRGNVVSDFPITDALWYAPEQMAVILALPPGTLTQRTLIYAVRTHPDHPASTDGQPDPTLLEEAESHSQYQADIRVQGHHSWGSRFARILSRLPRARAPREVCAESWAGQDMVDAAVECVRCWRLSSGHWSAVCARSRLFGYDMKRGANGIWYATGIVDAR